MKELNEKLYDMAKKGGCCNEWLERLSTCDKHEMLDMFVKGIDFSVNNDWIPLEFIKQNFTKYELNSHGIHIDENIMLDKCSGTIVLLGKCIGSIYAKEFDVATINCFDESNVNVVATDLSKVFVSLYDESMVQAEQIDAAKLYCYKRSENSKLSCSGDVLVRK